MHTFSVYTKGDIISKTVFDILNNENLQKISGKDIKFFVTHENGDRVVENSFITIYFNHINELKLVFELSMLDKAMEMVNMLNGGVRITQITPDDYQLIKENTTKHLNSLMNPDGIKYGTSKGAMVQPSNFQDAVEQVIKPELEN